MTRLTYAKQMLHPKWQQMRLRVFDAAGWACERCGETEITLHAHHREYRYGAMAWEYEVCELACLCSHCHASGHGKGRPPEGSLSAKRDVWELLLSFNLMACAEGADHPGVKCDVNSRARELCAASGYDYSALESLLS